MNEAQKKYYQRFSAFAVDCSRLVSILDWRNLSNQEWGKQLVRSSGSIGANYIEAIEGSSAADFIYRLRVCRKEAAESEHWLHLLMKVNPDIDKERFECLKREAREFVKMFSSSIKTTEKNQEMQNGK